MSDHSIAALKRKLDAANSRYAEAGQSLNNAKAALRERLCLEQLAALAAAGITPGSKVILSREMWRSVPTRTVIGFLRVEANSALTRVDYILSLLKKDGTPSAIRKHFYGGTLEPWEGSPEQAQEQGK
jgi:hypothetical protein